MSYPHDNPVALGTPATYGRNTFVMAERKALEAWAHLTMTSPRASALLQHLVARMGHQNAVVIAQKTLAKMMGCNTRTVQRALSDLVKGRWIQIVQLGTTGTVNAYVINSMVAWGESRDQIKRLAVFTANVVADADDQDAAALEHKELRILPITFPPEEAQRILLRQAQSKTAGSLPEPPAVWCHRNRSKIERLTTGC